MGIDVRKHVFGRLRKTKAQRLCYSLSGEHSSQAWSIHNSTFLANLCSLGDCFESRFVGDLEDRFCREEAHIISYADFEVLSFFFFIF